MLGFLILLFRLLLFRNQLQSQLLKMEKEVGELKQFAVDDPNMKMKVMITIIRQFGDDIIEAIEGRGTGEISTDKLSGEWGYCFICLQF